MIQGRIIKHDQYYSDSV